MKSTHTFSPLRARAARKEGRWRGHSSDSLSSGMLWEHCLKIIPTAKYFPIRETPVVVVVESRSKCRVILIHLDSRSLHRRLTKSSLGNHVTNSSHERQISERRRYVGLRISQWIVWIVEPELPFFFPRVEVPGRNKSETFSALGSTVFRKWCRGTPRPTMRDRKRIHDMTSTIWKLSRLSVSSKYYPIRKINRHSTSNSLFRILSPYNFIFIFLLYFYMIFLLYLLSNILDCHK